MTNNKLFILLLVVICFLGALSIIFAIQGRYDVLESLFAGIGGFGAMVLFFFFLYKIT